MNSHVGKKCPYCQNEIDVTDSTMLCSRCRTLHHQQCWIENQGCAEHGCGSSHNVDPKTVDKEDNHDNDAGNKKTRPCPKCGGEIPQAAVFCVHCQAMLSEKQGKPNVIDLLTEAFKFGLVETGNNIIFLILMQVGIFLGIGLAVVVAVLFSALIPPLSILMIIGIMVLGILVTIGVQIIYFKIVDNKPISIDDLFSGKDRIWAMIGTQLLVALGIVIGSILLIIPGLIFAVIAMFSSLVVIDKKVSGIEAISISMKLVRDNIALTLSLIVVMFVLNLIGTLLFGLAVLLTAPISAIILTYCYRKIS